MKRAVGSRCGRQRRLQRTTVRYIAAAQARGGRVGIHRHIHRCPFALTAGSAVIGGHIVSGIRIQCSGSIRCVCRNRRAAILYHVPTALVVAEAGSRQRGNRALAYRIRRAGGCSRFLIHHNRENQALAFTTVKQSGGIVMVGASRLLRGVIVTLIRGREGIAARNRIIPNDGCTRGHRSRQNLVLASTKTGGEIVGVDARDTLHRHGHMHTLALATRRGIVGRHVVIGIPCHRRFVCGGRREHRRA